MHSKISMNIIILGVADEDLDNWSSDKWLPITTFFYTQVYIMLELISHYVQKLVGAMVC